MHSSCYSFHSFIYFPNSSHSFISFSHLIHSSHFFISFIYFMFSSHSFISLIHVIDSSYLYLDVCIIQTMTNITIKSFWSGDKELGSYILLVDLCKFKAWMKILHTESYSILGFNADKANIATKGILVVHL